MAGFQGRLSLGSKWSAVAVAIVRGGWRVVAFLAVRVHDELV